MEDSKKKTNVEDLLTLKNDYEKEKVDQVLLREDKCDSSKDTFKDKISNGQAMQLGNSGGWHFDNRTSSMKGNSTLKRKSDKK